MLRKAFVSALVLLYSLSTVGMPLHFHYCMGELKHITLLVKLECHGDDSDAQMHACCGVMKSECGTAHSLKQCCDDATQWLHDNIPALCPKTGSDDDFAQADLILLPETEMMAAPDNPAPSLHSAYLPHSAAHLYLLNCSLIFYH